MLYVGLDYIHISSMRLVAVWAPSFWGLGAGFGGGA